MLHDVVASRRHAPQERQRIGHRGSLRRRRARRPAWELPLGRASARAGIGAALVIAAVVLTGPSVSAHSFLVSTTPGQGERSRSSPDAVVLEFSEPPDRATAFLELTRSNQEKVRVGEIRIAGVGMSAEVPETLEDGIYVVSWQALSAVDGHGTFGEFSFAVGDVPGTVPAAVEGSTSSWRDTLASWLFFAGLTLAVGPLLMALVDRSHHRRGVVRAGLLAALVGSGLSWLDAVDGRGGVLPAALAVALVAASISVETLTRRSLPPLATLAGAASGWAASSHAASSDGVLGWAVDVVHLLAGAAWTGALGVVVARGWAARSDGMRWLPVVRRYARLAFLLVLLLAAAGVVSSLLLVPTWQDLWGTTYGQLVLVKIALFGGAAGLAVISRSALGRARPKMLSRTVSAEAVLLVVALGVAAVVATTTPPAPALAAELLLGPPPLEAPVARTAGLGGQLNVELASDGTRLDLRVFSPSGPVAGTDVDVALRQPDGTRIDVLPRPCGAGCFTQQLELQEGATTVAVTVDAPEWSGGRFEGSLLWPPGPGAADRLRAVIATTRSIDRLVVAETVDSGPGSVVHENVFELSGDALIDAEPYAAGNVEDVRRLPGQPERLSLYVPGSQIYGVLTLDEQGRMVESLLISPGHEIRRKLRYAVD